MNCRLLFEQRPVDQEICKVLQEYPEVDQLRWEQESATIHSPSPVRDEEVLCRHVVDPAHYDGVTGTIKPTFFSDASSRGASCHRLAYTSEARIHKLALARVSVHNVMVGAADHRQAIGYAMIRAAAVREIHVATGGRRGAAIYDTAKADDVSHADICQLVSGKWDGKSVRAQLWQLAKDALVRFGAPPHKDSD